MARIDFTYLSQRDVIDAGLTVGDAVELVRASFAEHAAKAYENPPKPGIHPRPDAFLHAMPGYLPRRRVAGIKWVSGFATNPGRGLPTIMGLIVLNDVTTGQPVAVMNAAYVTVLRTAAASALAAKHLANPGAGVIGLVGAGVQGRYHLRFMDWALSGLRRARVFDVDAGALADLVSSIGPEVSFAVEAVGSAADAIAGADIVITATGKLDEPIFEEAWVEAGALVLPVHPRGWEGDMMDKADRMIVDDRAQFESYLDGVYPRLRRADAELGEVITGAIPGRLSPTERILNFNLGLAIHDVLMANEVSRRCRAKGLGTSLTLSDGEIPWV